MISERIAMVPLFLQDLVVRMETLLDLSQSHPIGQTRWETRWFD
jgi:hypothetical protein